MVRKSQFSPWGELYGQLLQAEAKERHLDGVEMRELTQRRADEAVAALTEARRVAKDNRDRVLQHPDLALRVKDALGLTESGRWNGYIPPRTLAESSCSACRRDPNRPCRREHMALANQSIVRDELIEILAEAWKRQRESVE